MWWLALLACGTPDDEATTNVEPVLSETSEPVAPTSEPQPEPTNEPDPEPEPVDLSDGYASIPASYGQTEPVIMLVAGDSISDSYGASSPANSYDGLLLNNNDATYPDFSSQDLSSWYPSLQASLDASFPGANTGTLISQQLPALEDALASDYPDGLDGPAIAFITIGGNDLQEAIFPWADPDEVVAASLDNMDVIMDWFTDDQRFPHGIEVYMTNVYDPSDDVGRSICFAFLNYADRLPKLEEFNRAVHDKAVARDIATIDLWGNFLGHGFNSNDETTPHYDAADPTRWFANDCIHPNDRGHHELRRLFLGAVGGQLDPFTP